MLLPAKLALSLEQHSSNHCLPNPCGIVLLVGNSHNLKGIHQFLSITRSKPVRYWDHGGYGALMLRGTSSPSVGYGIILVWLLWSKTVAYRAIWWVNVRVMGQNPRAISVQKSDISPQMMVDYSGRPNNTETAFPPKPTALTITRLTEAGCQTGWFR